jgi:hypothetical protein
MDSFDKEFNAYINTPSRGVSMTQAERDAALMEVAIRIRDLDILSYQHYAEKGRRERREREAEENRRCIEGIVISVATFGTMWAVYYFG